MHCHKSTVTIAEDCVVGTDIRVADAVLSFPHANQTEVSKYKFHIPLAPTRGIVIAESQRTVLAPTCSLAPDAMLGGWTQTRRLAHDFLVGQYSVTGKAVLR